MQKRLKRLLSGLLAVSMLASVAPAALAKEQAVSGASEISFSAAKYNVSENDGKIKIKIVRKGGNDRSVEVAFKTADFTAEYGMDYIVFDEDGNELPMADGITPSESEFIETRGKSVLSETDKEESEIDNLGPTEEPEKDQPSTVIGENGTVEEIAAPVDTAEQAETKKASTGSALLDAQAEYLNLPAENDNTSAAVENILTDVNKYFQEAQGAVGVVAFEEGETEKEVTIKLIDNDIPQSDKIVLLSLMGVNGDEETSLAANPTSYINIMDDEEYETPIIEPDTNEITLSEDNPDYELILSRTSGVDYYTSVLVSTVKGTAQEGYNYDKIENSSVSFAPGEKEKKVKISAENFGDEMSFGIRLESDGTCEISDEYITVTMSAKPSENSDAPSDANSLQNGDVSLMSAEDNARSGSVIGTSTTTKRLDDFNFVHGPSTGKQDGYHRTSWNSSSSWTDYYVYETYKKSGRTWVAENALNVSGVDKINLWHQNDGDYNGRWAAYHIFIELLRSWDKNNYSSGGDKNIRKDGRHGWTSDDMDVSSLNGEYYLRFGVRNDGYASDNGRAWLGNPVMLTWHQYNLNIQNKQVFNRLSYDYADKTGEALKIAYTDGKDDYDYIPSVKIVNNSGNEISGFYANANQTIKPISNNPSLDTKYGIELEGVYLYTKDNDSLYKKDRTYPYADHWYEDNTIWVPASGVKADQSLAEKLTSKFGSKTIKVMPKFRQKTVTLNIHNTDNEKTYIANMNSKSAESYRDWGANGYYNQYTFPIYSQIKVRAVAAKGKTVTGFNIDLWSQPTDKDPIYSDSSAPERMTYTLTENMSFYPRTENQGMNAAYMPGADKVINDLSGRVFTQPSAGESGSDIKYSDLNGNLNIQTVYPGMLWTMRATAPDGYYVKWTNGTGDIKNVNGKIDVSSDPNINEETENTKKFKNLYTPVYGDIMSGTIVQNNTKYYYEFVKNGNENGKVQGKVLREKGSFYDVVCNKNLQLAPAAATQVSVAGTAGFTDENGDFVIELKNVPTSGHVSVIVDDNGTMYPTTALANYMSITLPAYECFKPKSLSVRYNDASANKINGTVVNIKNDTLNIVSQAESNGSLQPTGAKYYIHKVNGTVIDCSADNRFTNSFANGTASISFNPKSVMDAGDKIYVAFIDQNDKEYKSMDIGYDFVAPLNLRTFMFPLIGSSLLDNTYSSAVELIGDPLGDVSLGKLGFDEPETEMVTPDGMDPEKYSYAMSTYKFGDFSKAIKTFSSKDNKDNKDDNNDENDKGTKSEETAKDIKNAVKDNGKETENGGYKTNKSFAWEFSPKAAFAMQITTRKDGNSYKYYFEELDFLVGLDYKVDGKITVTLPIGMNIIITGTLSGDVAGIFQLKTNYTGDSTWNNNKVEYTAESFGLFEEIDHVDRKAYLMVNPNISLGLGVEWAIIEVGGNANFKFDMDFEFGLNVGSLGHRMYGDMTYNFDYYIKVLSIKVYSGKTEDRTAELFSENADGHIEPDIIAGLMSIEGNEIQSIPTTRDYLNNTSGWNGTDSNMSLFNIDTNNTEELDLIRSAYPSTKSTLTPFGDGKILLTFIDDDIYRSEINRTALCYSIYDGETWWYPRQIDDDGTLDDYPNVFDLGDKIMISWSSADKVLNDNATAVQALTALDIKTVFFDKETETFSEVMQLTHTTDEDYTADVQPRAAYDSETGRIILYYTKTEYTEAQNLTDLIDAPSVIAYRFYENGKWNDETSYTEEELSDMTTEEKEAYKTNWYGQRFLDTRLNKTSADMLRIVDSDAISYNGLALYAWTVDYDKNLNTVDDRDVFMQIYNFSENSFTHIIKITSDSGAYSIPRFGRYNDETYLFYSAMGALDGSENEEQSGIAYLDVSDIIKNGKYTKVSENNTEYYKLEYTTMAAASTDQDGNEIPAHNETVQIQPSYAVTVDGYINNYCVDVDSDEKMYLTWTNSDENGSRQIYTSIFDIAPMAGAEADEDGSISKNYEWSEAFKLTNAENAAYGNIDSAVTNGKLYITSIKMPYTENKSLNESRANFVLIEHTPYGRPVTVEENALIADTKYIYPDTDFTLTSTIKNEGTKLIDKPVTFKFTMTSNGKTTEIGEQTIETACGAGETMSASVNVPGIEEISDDLTFNAEITVDDTVINQEMKAVKECSVVTDGDAALDEIAGGHRLHIPLRNEGNISSAPVSVKLYTAKDSETDELIDEYTIESIGTNSSAAVDETVEIPDSAYAIENGDGIADIIAVIEADGKELGRLETKAHKSFDAKAIETMNKVTDVSIKGSNKISAEYLDDIEIETQISGTAGEDVTVMWVSDNNDIIYVRDDNTLFASGGGTATLTGYVIPSVQNIKFSYDGTSEKAKVLDTIPSTLYKTVTAEVTVNKEEPTVSPTTEPTASPTAKPTTSPAIEPTASPTIEPTASPTSRPKHGGGGGSSVKSTPKPTSTAQPQETSAPQNTTEPAAENAMFDDTASHWAKDYIDRLAADDIVNGVVNRIFNPNGNITRAQFAQILMNTGLVEEGNIDVPAFTDVDGGAWYNEAVVWAVSCGVAKGMSNEIFEPEGLITREQTAVMVNRFIKLAGIEAEDGEAVSFTDYDNISYWAIADVEALAAKGILKGRDTGEFDPLANMTRAEGVVVICNILDAKEAK